MNENNKINYLWLVLLILIVIIGLAFYFSKNEKENELPNQDQTFIENDGNDNQQNENSDDDTLRIEVISSNFGYEPKEIRVKKDQKVRIVLKNNEGFHDWVVDEFNASTNKINSGQTAEIVFTANKIGEYEYYCSVGEHRKMGMVGKLIVE